MKNNIKHPLIISQPPYMSHFHIKNKPQVLKPVVTIHVSVQGWVIDY